MVENGFGGFGEAGFFAKQFEMLCNEGQESLEERFEREALKNLGGSIAFVSKKKAYLLFSSRNCNVYEKHDFGTPKK